MEKITTVDLACVCVRERVRERQKCVGEEQEMRGVCNDWSSWCIRVDQYGCRRYNCILGVFEYTNTVIQ